MDAEEILAHVFVGFLLFCLYAAIYTRVKKRVPLIGTTVGV